MSPRTLTESEFRRRIDATLATLRRKIAEPRAKPDPNRQPSALAYLQDQERVCREHIASIIAERAVTADAWAGLRDAEMLHAQKRRAELKVEMDEQSALIAERKGHYRTHSDALLAHLREELRAIEANDMEPRYATPIKALILRAQRDREHVLGEA